LAIDAETGGVLERTDLKLHRAPQSSQRSAEQRAARDDWTPHAHSACFSPCGRYLWVCEKGLDKVVVYAFCAETGTLTEHSEAFVTPGGGARHLAAAANGVDVYVNEEAGARVVHLRWSAEAGAFSVQGSVSTVWFADPNGPERFAPVDTAELKLGPRGDRLYVANRARGARARSTVACLRVDERDGSLAPLGFLRVRAHPRHFAFSPSGDWLVVTSLHDNAVGVFSAADSTFRAAGGTTSGAEAASCGRWLENVPSPTHVLFPGECGGFGHPGFGKEPVSGRSGAHRSVANRSGAAMLLVALGGTIDKDYPRLTKGYAFEFGAPAFERILADVSPGFSFRVETPFQKDSQEIDGGDREAVRRTVLAAGETRVVVTHGTDTMIETAAFLGACPRVRAAEKTIVLTGAMRPERFANSDARFNVGCAVGAAAAAPPGVYVAMNGRVRPWDSVERCFATGRFVGVGEGVGESVADQGE
jgi:L-asparaginase